jgi:hypothetical protein
VDGTATLLRFRRAGHRFSGNHWIELETTRIGRDGLLVPDEFSAGIPADQLVDAWLDYKQAVEEFNRARWSNESARRERERFEREAREDALREQPRRCGLLERGLSTAVAPVGPREDTLGMQALAGRLLAAAATSVALAPASLAAHQSPRAIADADDGDRRDHEKLGPAKIAIRARRLRDPAEARGKGGLVRDPATR